MLVEYLEGGMVLNSRMGLIATGSATVMTAMSVTRNTLICMFIDGEEVSLKGS
jgi:hypothetical protein